VCIEGRAVDQLERDDVHAAVVRLVDLAHPAASEETDDTVVAETVPGSHGRSYSAAPRIIVTPPVARPEVSRRDTWTG
jgi:hypothetical protein